MEDADAAALTANVGLAGAVAAIQVVDPGWGIAASAALPALQVAITRWQQVQADRAIETLNAAAEEAGLGADDLIDRLIADEERLSLLAAALNAATSTAMRAKIAALGRSLGALAVDSARIDPETVWIRILSDIEAPHVRILQFLLREDPEAPGHLRIVHPGNLGDTTSTICVARVLLHTLEQHGLAREVTANMVGEETRRRVGWVPGAPGQAGRRWYMAGNLAQECIDRLEKAGRNSDR
ncbi:MAG: hypothetical protein M3R02_24870 [Chloroflexota bacterium]|nr:hypothetical protein [Chloroflexota bacterium]